MLVKPACRRPGRRAEWPSNKDQSPMLTALTLCGSIRKHSYNRMLQEHVGHKLEAAGVAVNAISLADFEMPIFNEDLEPNHVPEAAGRLAELWRSHDIVFIA